MRYRFFLANVYSDKFHNLSVRFLCIFYWKSNQTFYLKWSTVDRPSLTLWRQHVLTCDIIVQLSPWPPRGQPAFTTQCDCQHSFPSLTRGAPHNQHRHHWAMSLGTAGWASMAAPTLSTSAPGCRCCTVTSVNTRPQECQARSQLHVAPLTRPVSLHLYLIETRRCSATYVMWRGAH